MTDGTKSTNIITNPNTSGSIAQSHQKPKISNFIDEIKVKLKTRRYKIRGIFVLTLLTIFYTALLQGNIASRDDIPNKTK